MSTWADRGGQRRKGRDSRSSLWWWCHGAGGELTFLASPDTIKHVTKPRHAAVLFLLGHYAGDLSTCYRIDKIAPVCNLSCPHGDLKGPTALGKGSSALFLPGWPRAGPHTSSWQHPAHCNRHVIAGRALVVAQMTVEFMTWWARAGIRYLLAVRGWTTLL